MKKLDFNIAVEGLSDEVAVKKILTLKGCVVQRTFGHHGKDWLRRNLPKFVQVSQTIPFLILTDLDDAECPPILLDKWHISPTKNLILRIAVRELEAWLLADKVQFSHFLGISKDHIPTDVENLNKPKEFVISLARRSRKRHIRYDMVPHPNSTSKIGRNYNSRLIEFIHHHWEIDDARRNSKSLNDAILAIERFLLK